MSCGAIVVRTLGHTHNVITILSVRIFSCTLYNDDGVIFGFVKRNN